MTSLNTIRVLIIIFAVCIFTSTFNLTAKSGQVTVPLNITVHGKLIITNAENDNESGLDPTINILLKLTPDLNNSVVSGASSVRIRTNLNNWKLTAKRINTTDLLTNISPDDISLSFSTQTGSKANPNAAKLLAPFDKTAKLSLIPTAQTADILLGNSKTSLDRDLGNKNNWFQLTTNYSVSPDFFYDVGKWDTTISYNLVSP